MVAITVRPTGLFGEPLEERTGFVGRAINWDLTLYARGGMGAIWLDLLNEAHGPSIATLAELNLYEAGEGLAPLRRPLYE